MNIEDRWFGFLTRIRRRHAYILSAVLAAIVIAAVYSYRSIDRELTESALSRRAALSYLAAAVLTEKFDRLVDIGVSLASRVRFRELVERGDWTEAVKILSGVPADFPFIDRITLNSVDGTLMADAPAIMEVRGRNFAHRDWHQAVMRTGRPYISQVYMRVAEPQMNVFVAAIPIKSGKGEILGLLVLQVRSDRFFNWIAEVEVGAGGLVYIVDRRGMLAAHPDFSSKGELIDYSGMPIVQQLLQGNRGVEIVSNTVGGDKRVMAYEPIARHGWGVVLEQPSASAFAARDDQLRRVLIAYALITSFIVFVAYLASRIVTQQRRTQEDGRINAELVQTTRTLEREIAERRRTEKELAIYSERLNILHEIDRAIIAAEAPDAIAETALQSLRKLIAVPRAIVNIFDLEAGEAEWLAGVGRRRVHRGPGVRFSMHLMGDVESLRKGELQVIDTTALPPGPEVDALLASGIHEYMVVPMIARGELIGGLSFGGAKGEFPMEHVGIVQEVAAQLAIAVAQARLYERVKRQAEDLEVRVAERTALLEAATRELEDTYNNSPCGYHSVDENGLIIQINDTELAWLGYDREEVVGKLQHADLMTPESAEFFRREAFPLFKRQGWLKNAEFTYVRKQGGIMPASLNATAVCDADGNLLMSRSTLYDISDRKRAEADMAAQFRTLQSIIDNLPGAVSLFSRDLQMTACNDKFKTLLGLPDHLFGDGPPSFASLIRHNARNGEYGPGDPEQLTAQIVERARHVVPHCFERVRPDGTVLEIRGTPMPDGGFVTYYSDITERKRAEDALREREERFRLLVSAVKDYSILMLDTEGRVVTWNEGAERIKGYRADEIVGQHFSRFYTREESGKPAHELKVAAAEGRCEDEGWRVRKDGSTFWASVVITAVRDEAGTLRGFSKVTRDLTQYKQAEAEIRQLNQDLEHRAAQLEITNKELEGFSYSVSHDLRSPLRAIDGYSQMLEEDYAATLDEEGRRLLAVIRDSSQKMAMLIDDLLNFSRLGRQPIVTTMVDMNGLLNEVVRDVRSAGADESLPIAVADLPDAQGDRALLKQVWINLLTNAIKFSGANDTPAIEISGTSNTAETVYRVKDNGVGFDMQYYNKLFGVFQRLHSADEFPGTGVGLAIVHRVVSRHGGRVWAEAKLNQGAAFFFALPNAGRKTGEQIA